MSTEERKKGQTRETRREWRNPETCMCSRAPVSPDVNLALLDPRRSPNPNSKCQERNLIITALSLFFPGPETTSTSAMDSCSAHIPPHCRWADGGDSHLGEGRSDPSGGCRNGSSGLVNQKAVFPSYTRSTVGFPSSLCALPYSKRIIFSPPGLNPCPLRWKLKA